jgi:peptidylprolyl isomerase
VIQAGDPTGTGTAGPGYVFDDEPISPDLDYAKGTIAMANAGPNTNGSQFFICSDDLTGQLPKNYTIFGQVVDGLEIVDELDGVPTEVRNGEKSSPIDPVTLEEVTIEPTASADSGASDEDQLESRFNEYATVESDN